MCGFYGSTKIYDPTVISAKLRRVAFRGPDASTFRNFDNRVILGHNRLAIIDLDERSNQPFDYEHIAIVFNGEIYNFQKIKTDLEKRGFHFRTTSDTEVLCAAYLAFGEDCVKHFNGMFAFVLFAFVSAIFFQCTMHNAQCTVHNFILSILHCALCTLHCLRVMTSKKVFYNT